jgi:hypothetical protein
VPKLGQNASLHKRQAVRGKQRVFSRFWMTFYMTMIFSGQKAKAMLGGLALLALFAHNSTVRAEAVEKADISYNVYVGATKMFKITYKAQLTTSTYQARMKLKPKGLARLFANISMVMETGGKFAKNRLAPTSFSFFNKKKKRKRTSIVSWNASGLAKTTRDWKFSPERDASLMEAAKSGVLDPVAAILKAGVSSVDKPCSKNQRIYDGRNVYDLQFKFLKKVTFDAKSGGAYRGIAYKCQVKHKPIAGYSKKSLKKRKKNPIVFTLWFAPVVSQVVKKTILLPIAAAGKVKGRSFTAFTTKGFFANKPI